MQNTEFTIKLKQLEDELLFKLSNAEGDITEDVALIESLEESKRVATEINEKASGALTWGPVLAARRSPSLFLCDNLERWACERRREPTPSLV